MNSGAAQDIFESLLREETAIGIDLGYFSTNPASGAAHAGLLNGVSAITATGGGDRAALLQDILALSDTVNPGGSGAFALITSPERAIRLGILLPDLKFPVLASSAVANSRVVGVDPASLVHLVDPAPEMIASEEGVIHMEDSAPAEIVSATGPTTANPVRSLWQTDSIAFSMIAYIAFAKRRANAVSFIDGPTW